MFSKEGVLTVILGKLQWLEMRAGISKENNSNIFIAMMPVVVHLGIHIVEFPAEWPWSLNHGLSFKLAIRGSNMYGRLPWQVCM